MRGALPLGLVGLLFSLLLGCTKPAEWTSHSALWGAWARVDQRVVTDDEGDAVLEDYQHILHLRENGSFTMSNAVIEQDFINGAWEQVDGGTLRFSDENCGAEGLYTVAFHSGTYPYNMDDGYDLEISLQTDSCPHREETLDAFWAPKYF